MSDRKTTVKKPKKHAVPRKDRPVNALSAEERDRLIKACTYEGHPHHKRRPGDFNLTPPAEPRFQKTLCDVDGVELTRWQEAQGLLERGIQNDLVSAKTKNGYPAHIWAVRDDGTVFEAKHGGSREGRYHGYPLFEGEQNHDMVCKAWWEDMT
jgi:hypothetical protein